jgi:hypothetical protein
MARKKTKRRIRIFGLHKSRRKQKRLIHYPVVLFIVLCSGVLLVCWTINVFADSITVRATVPASLPSVAATITNPSDGAHFTSVPISVSGTCPSSTYVEIFRNSVFSGTAICEADNTYQLQIDLFAGTNELVPHVFNVTDDEGSVGLTTTVYYDVPQQPINPSTPSEEIPVNNPANPTSPTSPAQNVEPLTLTSGFKIKGYYVGQNITWDLQIAGGIKPYAVNVSWGDGSNSVVSVSKPGKFTIKHKYTSMGGYKGSYPVKISASDSEGRQTYLQIFIIVNPKTPTIVGNIYTPPSSSFFSTHEYLLKFLWPAYAMVTLMAVSFELGEREELLVLRGRGHAKRRRA